MKDEIKLLFNEWLSLGNEINSSISFGEFCLYKIFKEGK